MNAPKSLKREDIAALPREDLVRWAEAKCLLEHLDAHEIAAMDHIAIVGEVMGALLRLEVWEDRRAMATDTQSHSVEDMIGGLG